MELLSWDMLFEAWADNEASHERPERTLAKKKNSLIREPEEDVIEQAELADTSNCDSSSTNYQ